VRSKYADVVVHSIRLGLLAQIAGCSIFLALEELWQVLKYGSSSFESRVDVEIAILIFIVGNVLAFFPTVACSYILVWVLKSEASKGRLILGKSKSLGALVGCVAGMGMSVLGIVLTNGRGGILEYLLRITEVVAITSVAGAWLGERIMRFILRSDTLIV
jgi:uncharacterized membrane protein YjgN (DUF898 family)